MAVAVKMLLDDDGRYIRLIAQSEGGIEFDVLRIERVLLNGDFCAVLIDSDNRFRQPTPEPELSVKK